MLTPFLLLVNLAQCLRNKRFARLDVSGRPFGSTIFSLLISRLLFRPNRCQTVMVNTVEVRRDSACHWYLYRE
jgi:hypothetical protein